MSFITTSVLKNSTIMLLFSEKPEIKMDPEYQRSGGVWTLEKKQLLIDSILNDYDIPKIYFHDLEDFVGDESGYQYAVIDGRQRLETIWEFLENKFPLSQNFDYQRDNSIHLQKLYYKDIATQFPKIRVKLDSFVLPIILVKTSEGDIDLIEDMFSRLNEAVPLNSAEKRNAIGGYLVKAITRISKQEFFSDRVKFSNSRFQHRESSARIVLVEDCFLEDEKLIDTKKVYLDRLAERYKSKGRDRVEEIVDTTEKTLTAMSSVFSTSDALLSAQGNIVIYYLLFKEALIGDNLKTISRKKLLDFGDELKQNRIWAANENHERTSFELLEYDRLTQQGTNDASNIRERYRILANYVGLKGNLFS